MATEADAIGNRAEPGHAQSVWLAAGAGGSGMARPPEHRARHSVASSPGHPLVHSSGSRD